MRRLTFIIAAILLTVPAQADTWDDCNNRDNPARMLSACSAIIEDGSTPKDRLSVAYLYRCQAKDMQGDPNGAVSDCLTARALDPGDASIYNSLTIIYLKLGNTSEAVNAADEGVRQEPGDGNYWNGRANARCAAGQYEGSFSDRLKALELGRFTSEGLQDLLANRGYYSGAIDGKFGTGSRLALRNWTYDGCR